MDPVIPLKARKGALHVQGKFTNSEPPKNLWRETDCHIVGQQVSQPLYVTEAQGFGFPGVEASSSPPMELVRPPITESGHSLRMSPAIEVVASGW